MPQNFDINNAILFINNYHIGYLYTKKELKSYYDWFMANLDNHLKQFSDTINSFDSNINWVNDFTPDSLIRVAHILYTYVKGVFISEEEYQRRVEAAHIVLKDSVMHVEMTHDERVFTFLLSVYVGEVIIRSYPNDNLKWELSKFTKSFAHCGYMLIHIAPFIYSAPLDPANWLMIGILKDKYENQKIDLNLLYDNYCKVTRTLREKSI